MRLVLLEAFAILPGLTPHTSARGLEFSQLLWDKGNTSQGALTFCPQLSCCFPAP